MTVVYEMKTDDPVGLKSHKVKLFLIDTSMQAAYRWLINRCNRFNCWVIGIKTAQQQTHKLVIVPEGCANKMKVIGLQVHHVWATALSSIKGCAYSYQHVHIYAAVDTCTVSSSTVRIHVHVPNTCPLTLQGPLYRLHTVFTHAFLSLLSSYWLLWLSRWASWW